MLWQFPRMTIDHPTYPASRRAGNKLIIDQAQSQVQTFFDELKNGTPNYRTVASLSGQVAQEYRGRCILELLQNAHDALADAPPGDPRRVSFVLSTDPEPVLLIGNSGRPFRTQDFHGICRLAQSPKDPNKSVGNKGLGFRSVLEICTGPEIWSTAPAGSDTSFIFRFDPDTPRRVAEAARRLAEQGLDARSPFDPDRPLVDWSQDHLSRYRERLAQTEIDGAEEATNFLSPYQIPLPIEGMPPAVKALLSAGHATVVRLRLDGGKAASRDEAVQSVKDQLQELDARSTIFLDGLTTLVIDADGDRRALKRSIDSNGCLSGHPRTWRQRLRVDSSAAGTGPEAARRFRLWTRVVGGKDDPDHGARLRAVVSHLPNRWPEVRRVSVGVAVEEAAAATEGVFVIFLPTEMKTGTGAHINAPFYGSLDRRQINFREPYNELLLDCVLDLCLDVVRGLLSREPEDWSARAVVDLLSSAATVDNEDRRFLEGLQERATERDITLGELPLVLCDAGWRVPSSARIMPEVPGRRPDRRPTVARTRRVRGRVDGAWWTTCCCGEVARPPRWSLQTSTSRVARHDRTAGKAGQGSQDRRHLGRLSQQRHFGATGRPASGAEVGRLGPPRPCEVSADAGRRSAERESRERRLVLSARPGNRRRGGSRARGSRCPTGSARIPAS